MIRNLCTCGAYSIRPYPDGRKSLFLRSIWGYAKWNDPFFDPENGYAESIIPLLESRKSYAKCIDLLFESKNGHAKWHNYFFDLKNGHAKWQERISGTCF